MSCPVCESELYVLYQECPGCGHLEVFEDPAVTPLASSPPADSQVYWLRPAQPRPSDRPAGDGLCYLPTVVTVAGVAGRDAGGSLYVPVRWTNDDGREEFTVVLLGNLYPDGTEAYRAAAQRLRPGDPVPEGTAQ